MQWNSDLNIQHETIWIDNSLEKVTELQTLNALRLDNLETSMIGQLSKSNLEITN